MDWIYIARFKAPNALYITHSHHIDTGDLLGRKCKERVRGADCTGWNSVSVAL